MTRNSTARTAAAWFRRQDWDEIKLLCSDDLPNTFDEWLAEAEAGYSAFLEQGFLIEKIFVSPDDIRERQMAAGREVDSKGRAEIAVMNMVKSDNSRTRN